MLLLASDAARRLSAHGGSCILGHKNRITAARGSLLAQGTTTASNSASSRRAADNSTERRSLPLLAQGKRPPSAAHHRRSNPIRAGVLLRRVAPRRRTG